MNICLHTNILLFLSRDYVNTLTAVGHIKYHDPICGSKQGIIATSAYIKAGLDAGATLADQDIAGKYKLTGIAFHAQALGIAISSVAA